MTRSILGEKLQYYYSSSEDEESDKEDDEGEHKTIRNPDVLEPELEYSADGSAINTGNTRLGFTLLRCIHL